MKRVENIKKIIDENFNGSQTTFAKAISKSPAQVNQWLNGRRNVGNGVAVEIEKTLGLPIGTLDLDENNQFSNIINHGKIGTQNNVSGDQNTNNFFSEETTEKEVRAILGDKEAVFLTNMPELSIDDGVEYALNPKEKGVEIRSSMQRSETFIPNSDMTFRIKIAEPILNGISPTPILQNDILIIEPRIPPRNQDLVLVCLDYQQPMQRGMIARLTIGTDRSLFIKHSDNPAEPLPENALICGVVSDVQRHMLPPDLVLSRIDTKWNILNTLNIKKEEEND